MEYKFNKHVFYLLVIIHNTRSDKHKLEVWKCVKRFIIFLDKEEITAQKQISITKLPAL